MALVIHASTTAMAQRDLLPRRRMQLHDWGITTERIPGGSSAPLSVRLLRLVLELDSTLFSARAPSCLLSLALLELQELLQNLLGLLVEVFHDLLPEIGQVLLGLLLERADSVIDCIVARLSRVSLMQIMRPRAPEV